MIRGLMACSMALVLLLAGCSAPSKAPDLGGIYNHPAQHEDPYRNPVILIPGLLGSKLVDPDSEIMVWGAFGTGTLNPNKPEDARLFGLPMSTGQNLYELKDRVKSTGTLDRVVVNFGGYPIHSFGKTTENAALAYARPAAMASLLMCLNPFVGCLNFKQFSWMQTH